MRASEIKAYLGADWTEVTELLARALRSDVELLEDINAGILANSGKMLRPMLTLLAARACNGGQVSEESRRYAAAVEILHNATLLHDDVADAAPTRRGTPTVVSQWGATPAVLVGDFWLAKAVSLLMDSSNLKWTIAAFGRTLINLSEGEMLQQQKAFSADTTVEDYLRIIYCKTASLFETACQAGARSVGADESGIDAMSRYGRAIGMAFQIRDDILDYDGGEQTGKPRGIDLEERKITLPLLGALNGSPREAEIRAMIRDIPSHPEYTAEINAFVHENGGVERAGGRLEEFVKEAVDALSGLPASKDREILEELSYQLSERER